MGKLPNGMNGLLTLRIGTMGNLSIITINVDWVNYKVLFDTEEETLLNDRRVFNMKSTIQICSLK